MRIHEVTQQDEGIAQRLAGLAVAGAAAGGLGYSYLDSTEKTKPETSDSRAYSGKIVDPVRDSGIKPITGNEFETVLLQRAKLAGIRGKELVAFMSQSAHETMGFRSLVELGDQNYFRRYDPRYSPGRAKILGNTNPGDGTKYRGRGYLQITGKYNYSIAARDLGLPLVERPYLLEDPAVAADVSIWYWMRRVRPAVDDFSNVEAVTRRINPGLKGLDDRKRKFNQYLKTASISSTPKQ
jgi:putative chitinase